LERGSPARRLRPEASTPNSVGLVHDYLLVRRGAERAFGAMASCWPEAPVYTLLCDPDSLPDELRGRRITVSALGRLPARQQSFRKLLPLFPPAVARLPVSEHDLVVSSSSAFAHGVRPGPGAVHVCYCHSPFRYAWHERRRALEEVPRALRPPLAATLEAIRRWDLRVSARVSRYIANSEVTRRRIADFYGRDATVIHPPVDVHRYAPGEPEDFFVVVTELVPHKRVDQALEAAERAGARVKVVGGGPELERLRARYGSFAEFLGRVGDSELEDLLPRAQALLLPTVEEFGIAAVEVQAAGRPVVAVDAGGAQETVVPGETGVLVEPESVDAMAEAIRYTDFRAFSPDRIVENAGRFDVARFRERLSSEVSRAYAAGPAPDQRAIASS
jgi:glycosyltransferase involved in cell wall biosynthesis